MVEIKEVKNNSMLRKFVAFPINLYKDNPYAVPDLRMDEKNNLKKSKNPAFEYCEARYFLAYKNGKVAGRIAAIINHAANEKWETNRIRFCRVDFIDDYEVSKALFDAAEGWARERGYTEIIGPMGFCDLDKEGMLVEGFNEKDMFITYYNSPYYIDHLTKLGYTKEVDWEEFQITIPQQVDERIKLFADRVAKRSGLTYYELKTKKQVVPYIPQIFELLNEAYQNLYGTVPLTSKQIDWYVGQFLSIINIKFVKLVMDENNKLAGFGLAAPSLSEALRKSRGRLFPFGFLRILRAIRNVETMDLYLIAVRPHLVNKGIPAIILEKMTEAAIEMGVKFAETGPELETNEKVRAMWKGYDARQHRRRRCFIKAL